MGKWFKSFSGRQENQTATFRRKRLGTSEPWATSLKFTELLSKITTTVQKLPQLSSLLSFLKIHFKNSSGCFIIISWKTFKCSIHLLFFALFGKRWEVFNSFSSKSKYFVCIFSFGCRSKYQNVPTIPTSAKGGEHEYCAVPLSSGQAAL